MSGNTLAAFLSLDARKAKAEMQAFGSLSEKEIRRLQNSLRYAEDALKKMATTQKAANDSANMGRATKDMQDYGKAAELTAKQVAQAKRLLPAQMTDIVTGLASGQQPWLVLIQQGGQIKDMFGGIGGAARALLTMVTPLNVALAAGAVILGSFAYFSYQASQAERDFANTTALTGNVAGMTSERMDSMASSLAAMAGSTKSAARETLQAVAESGAKSIALYEAVGRAATTLSRLNGKSAADNVKVFEGIEGGVTSWSEKANKAYGFLTVGVYKQIMALESQGRASEAAALAVNSLATAIESRKDIDISGWQKAGQFFSKMAENIAAGVARMVPAMDSADRAKERLLEIAQITVNGTTEPVKGSFQAQRLATLRADQAAYEAVQAEGTRLVKSQAAARAAEEQKVLLASRAYVDADLAKEAAHNSLLLAETSRGFDQRKSAAEAGYASLKLSGQQYRDAVYRIERERILAEQKAAQQSVDIERARVTSSVLEMRAKEAAITQAQAKLPPIKSKLDKLDSEYLNGDAAAYRTLLNEATKYERETDILTGRVRALSGAETWAEEQRKALTQATTKLTAAQEANARSAIEAAAARRQAVEQEAAMQKLLQDIGNKNAQKDAEASLSFDVASANAMTKFFEDVGNQSKYAENMVTGSMQRMEDSLINFVKTGKLSFSSMFSFMAEEFLRNLFRMQMKTAVTDSGGNFIGWGSMFAKLFSGGTAAGEHAGGLDYVPYDGYPAILHKGEKVQTAVEAGAARNNSGQGPTFDFSGQVLHVGQGVSRAEVDAVVARRNTELEQRMRRLSRQGVFG